MRNTAFMAYFALLLASAAPVAAQLQATDTETGAKAFEVGNVAAFALGGTGTANFLPLWLTSTQLGSSVFYQKRKESRYRLDQSVRPTRRSRNRIDPRVLRTWRRRTRRI